MSLWCSMRCGNEATCCATRLMNVRLVMVETENAGKKDVRLRIEAMLRMDPVPEPVSFDTVIELKSGSCHVSGGDDAR